MTHMDSINRFRRWFEYEIDSHTKTLDSLKSVPDSARAAPDYRKALDLMAHIATARRLWLHRLGVLAEGPSDLFPAARNWRDLQENLQEIQRLWSAYLAQVTDGDLSRPIEYRSLEGGWFRNTLEDILTQLFGHSWYHRGQIAALVRSLGGKPAETDFIFWSRRSISPPGT